VIGQGTAREAPAEYSMAVRAHGNAPTPWTARLAVSDVLLPLAAALWLVAVRQTDIRDVNEFGLVPALPVPFFIALAVLTVSFIATLRRDEPSTIRLAIHLVALVVGLQALVPLLFPLPQYGYVFKHIGVVEYITLHGSVDDRIDIYQNWPGFFALAAWFDRLAGLPNPVSYAAWAPLYFDLLAVLAINVSSRALSVPWRARWLALYIFVIANWVGQDYFAPQAFAFVLSQWVLALLLTLFRAAPAPWIGRLEERVTNLARGVYVKTAPLVSPALTRRQRLPALIAIFATFAVITFSHQLSPYMVIVGAGVLAVPGLLRPRWIVAVLIVIAGWYLATRYGFLRTHGDLILSFNPFKNVENPDASPNQGVLGKVVTGQAARILSGLVWALALVGAFRRSRSGSSALVPLGLFFAPFLIIFGQEYGGEAIYRVFLFSLPWAAGLAAVALAPAARWTWWASVRIGIALSVITALFLQAYFGLAEINAVRPSEVAASDYFYGHARAGSVLILAAPNYPERGSPIYDHFVVTSGAYDPKLVPNPEFTHRMLGPDDLDAIESVLKSYAPHGYFAITSGMKIYVHDYALLPDGALDNLDHALAASKRWKLFFRNQDSVIYELVAPATKT
jgi:hypothetical protein